MVSYFVAKRGLALFLVVVMVVMAVGLRGVSLQWATVPCWIPSLSVQIRRGITATTVEQPRKKNIDPLSSPLDPATLDPVYRLINRVLGYNNSQQDFELMLFDENNDYGNGDDDENDDRNKHKSLPCQLPCFTIDNADDGRITIAGGPTVSEVTAGIGWYLRNVAHATSLDIWPPFNITNINTSSPESWPIPVKNPIVRRKMVKHSYLMNVCTHSYSLVWYSANDWERFIDWMALSGINLMLALTGQEWIQYKVFKRLGLNDTDIRYWFNGPAFLTWSRGQNEYGSKIGGPLPISWMKAQWKMQREIILPRIRELGIIGQLPAFQGNVPIGLKTLYGDANITEDGATGWMDSLDPLFGKVAQIWMETLIQDFGTDHWYQLDGYFNGGTAPWMIDGNQADQFSSPRTISGHDETWYRRGVAAYQGLNATDPLAIWSFQGFAFVGWNTDEQASYLKGFVDSVPDKERFVILDMSYDPQQPEWEKWNHSAFFGASFVWTVLHNFGGTDGIKGDMQKVNRIPFAAMKDYDFLNPQHNIIGLGATPEGITQNPAYYRFLYEQAFQKQPINELNTHLILKMQQRYGINIRSDFSPEIASSWTFLLASLYSTDRSVQDGTGVAHSRNIRDAASLFEKDRYTPTETMCHVFSAWEHLVNASQKSRKHNLGFHQSQAFQYDLVNLGREVLAQLSTPAALNFSDAISPSDPESSLDPLRIIETGNFYQELLLDLDELVDTEETFRLERWIKSARQLGKDSNDCEPPAPIPFHTNKNDDDILLLQQQGAVSSPWKTKCEIFYEWNARCQVTTWNPTAAHARRVPGGPIDYAAKHWSGLIREYYVPRINLMQKQASQDAASHQSLNESHIDELLAQHAYNWTLLESYRPDSEQPSFQNASVKPAYGFIDVSEKMLRKYQGWFYSPSCTRSILSDS